MPRLSNNEYNKGLFRWNFAEDDWLIDLFLCNKAMRHQIFIVKNYNMQKINEVIFDLLKAVHKYRAELEDSCQAFIDKKKYLNLFKNDNKIQITLEEEYLLKDLIEQYKIYEAIGWFHIGKNSKIVKYCIIKKKEIIEKIYPIVNLSIRKVIGAKVISPYKAEFEEAVNNAWTAIIKYLPKIDTSRVMFSIFIGIAHRSAIYYNATDLKNKYNSVNVSDLGFLDNESNDLTSEDFFNTVLNKQSIEDIEDEILSIIEAEEMEDRGIKYSDNSYNYDKEIDNDIQDILDDIGESTSTMQYIQESILAHSYGILSGRIKHICLEKIFAEFFQDLVNNQISEKIINKHTPVIIEVMNAASINIETANTEENNIRLYRLIRDWIKEKIAIKLKLINATAEDNNNPRVLELIEKEESMIEYIKEHRSKLLTKFVEFKNAAVKLT